MKRQQGFTIIELAIVIVILGILAAAIIPTLSRAFRDVKNAAATYAVTDRLTGKVYVIDSHYKEVGDVISFEYNGVSITLATGWILEKIEKEK
jgi:prepilin-type N-terminal cleavage/methylation domain-containing protein